MLDCVIDRFMAHSVNYNSDGSPSPTLPYFKGIVIKNTIISATGREVELIGFTEEGQKKIEDHYVHDVLLENVILGNENDLAFLEHPPAGIQDVLALNLKRLMHYVMMKIMRWCGMENSIEPFITVI